MADNNVLLGLVAELIKQREVEETKTAQMRAKPPVDKVPDKAEALAYLSALVKESLIATNSLKEVRRLGVLVKNYLEESEQSERHTSRGLEGSLDEEE